MKIDEPTEREVEDILQIIYANNTKLQNLVKPNHIGVIYCQCDYGAKCPNNSEKKLVGAFELCKILIKKS